MARGTYTFVKVH